MRAFLNNILSLIGAATLTDAEFESLTIETAANDVETYNALDAVLATRAGLSPSRDRLIFYFKSKGVEVGPPSVAPANIFIGTPL